MWQDIVNTAGSSYGSWAKLFANVSNIAGNILFTYTLSTTYRRSNSVESQKCVKSYF